MIVKVKGDEFGIMLDRDIYIEEDLLNDLYFNEWSTLVKECGKEKAKEVLNSDVCKHMSLSDTLRVSRFISNY